MTENILKLYFIKSPFGLNWSSATALSRTILKNYLAFKPRFMGHVNIELKGTLTSGEKIDVLTGMVAANLNAKKLLFKKHIGMGIVFHSFKGHLETKEEMLDEIKEYQKKGDRINSVCFQISQEVLELLYNYYQEYKEQRLYKYYGLYNRPLFKEGSGCSAFGASFLQLAGLMNSKLKEAWSYQIKIPLKYLGMPIQERKVNFFKLMLTYNPWANSEEEGREIFFWDPDKMYRWVEEVYQNPVDGFEKRLDNGVHSLFQDVSHWIPEVKTLFQKDDRQLPLWEENNWD